jgi:hypothetical protein
VRDLQAQAAVDNAHGDQQPAVPHVCGGPEGAHACAHEYGVLHEAEDGLEQEEHDDGCAESLVRVRPEL